MSRAAIVALPGLAIIACATSAGLEPCPKRCYTTDGRLRPEMRACAACLPPSDQDEQQQQQQQQLEQQLEQQQLATQQSEQQQEQPEQQQERPAVNKSEDRDEPASDSLVSLSGLIKAIAGLSTLASAYGTYKLARQRDEGTCTIARDALRTAREMSEHNSQVAQRAIDALARQNQPIRPVLALPQGVRLGGAHRLHSGRAAANLPVPTLSGDEQVREWQTNKSNM